MRMGLVFAVVAALSSYLQWQPGFRDPDSYYHMQMATMLAEKKFSLAFPWLPFTTLSSQFADHHFLYHLFLTPFIELAGPEVGLKIASVFFCAAAATAFYHLLRVYGVRFPLLWLAVLLANAGFLFRFNLAKTPAPSLLFLFLLLGALKKRWYGEAFFLAWGEVWLHGSWPILGLIVAAQAAARGLTDRRTGTHTVHSWGQRWYWRRLLSGSRDAWRRFVAAPEGMAVAAVTGGVATGLVVNPFFPHNLAFYWQQIFQIAVVGYRFAVAPGMEWNSLTWWQLLLEMRPFVVAVVAVCAGVFLLASQAEMSWKELKREELFDVIFVSGLVAVLCWMTLSSQRHIEYLLPLAVLLVALYAERIIERLHWPSLARLFGSWTWRTAAGSFAVVLLLAAGDSALLDIRRTRLALSDSPDWRAYAGVGLWLNANVPRGQLVGNLDWDLFPILFRNDPSHPLVWGLDPRFLYFADPVRFYMWRSVAEGLDGAAAAQLMRREFGVWYVVARSSDAAARSQFSQVKGVTRQFDDGVSVVYQLR